MTLAYIRNAYTVPAFRGARVRFRPDTRDKPLVGHIVSSRDSYVRCRFDGVVYNCHPHWQMEYMTPDGWWSPETRRHRQVKAT